MSARAQKDAGFTLVEALVSLFVFSLIASGCVAMLMQSVESQRRVGQAHEALRQLQTTRALLSDDLAQLVLRDVRELEGRRPRFIGGDADAPLAVVRAGAEPGAARQASTALTLVEYRFADGQLIRASRGDLDSGAPMAERVLMSDAGAPRFEFFDGTAWRENWLVGPGGGAPPRAVALIVQSALWRNSARSDRGAGRMSKRNERGARARHGADHGGDHVRARCRGGGRREHGRAPDIQPIAHGANPLVSDGRRSIRDRQAR